MKKIPTLFQRGDDRRSVIDAVTTGCEWVLTGEGRATRKWDGTCCKVESGRLYARREVKAGGAIPADFTLEELDANTGKAFGWVPVGNGPEWAIHREAFTGNELDGTYELIGPKINRNPDHWDHHALIPHGVAGPAIDPPRTYDGLRRFLADLDWEGLVFWHPDGRKAKIKRRDFPRDVAA